MPSADPWSSLSLGLEARLLLWVDSCQAVGAGEVCPAVAEARLPGEISAPQGAYCCLQGPITPLPTAPPKPPLLSLSIFFHPLGLGFPTCVSGNDRWQIWRRGKERVSRHFVRIEVERRGGQWNMGRQGGEEGRKIPICPLQRQSEVRASPDQVEEPGFEWGGRTPPCGWRLLVPGA